MRRIRDGQAQTSVDTLAAEEPLEMRIGDLPLAVTMRTPGHDFDLALGFLLTEGVVTDPRQVRSLRYCVAVDEDQHHNVLTVDLAAGVVAPSAGAARRFLTTSSCGLCGKASIDQVRARSCYSVQEDPLVVSSETLASLPGQLASRQVVFGRTGGLHAAGLFDSDGRMICLREDVGRHNAFDKVIGWAASSGRLPLRSHLILASGRASFELTQKALMAGIPLLAAVSAPSSLAVELAEESGMTLVGFLRDQTMNVYTGEHRVRSSAHGPAQR